MRKIATLTVHDITHEELLNQLQSTTGSLIIEIKDDEQLQSVDVDVINEFRQQTLVADFLKKTFDFGTHHLKKDKVEVKLLKDGNILNISARKSIDISDGYQEVASQVVAVSFTVSTGTLTPPFLKTKTFEVNIDDEVAQDIKDELLNDFNLSVSGVWSDLTVNGACKITIDEVSDNTVFVGNKIEGFLFE